MTTGRYLPRERAQAILDQMELSLASQQLRPRAPLKEGEILQCLAEQQPFYDAYEDAIEQQLPKMGIRRHDGSW